MNDGIDQNEDDLYCIGGYYSMVRGNYKFIPDNLHDPIKMEYVGIKETKLGHFYVYRCPTCKKEKPI